MSKILLDIKIKYDTLSKTEKKVADYILNNPSDILPLFISELSKTCGVSDASIVRFSKKLGFLGYQQLKIAVAQESGVRAVGANITSTDTAYDVFEKICDDIYCSLEKTKLSLRAEDLQACCDKILSADKILIFGLGNSASVAMDASHKLFRLGFNAIAYTDNHMQAIASAHTDEKSVVIGISHSGHSKDVIESMKVAKSNGATTIALTNHGKSPIEKASSIVLHTVSDETGYRILGLSSRITQLAIIDTLYSYLVCQIKNVEDRIDKTELVLRSKKI